MLLFFVQNVCCQPGANDPSFNEFNKYSGADNSVKSITVQADGKIIATGFFKYYNGILNNYIVRLNVDGSLDESFVTGTGFNNSPNAIAIQSDGKIIVVGGFGMYNDKDQRHIIRLNNDGSLDDSFSLKFKLDYYDDVTSVVVQSDGKIIIGGSFTYYNNFKQKSNILRLNPDGSLDENYSNTFGYLFGFNHAVRSIALQSDGKIIVGGEFTSFNNKSQNYIVRLNEDGSLDENFSVGNGFNNSVSQVFVQFDGKILVGGTFSTYNGSTTQNFVRLNSDGSLDKNFSLKSPYFGTVFSIAQQLNDKIILVGSFELLDKKNIISLNIDGSIDEDFNVGLGFNLSVYTVALQSDGKIIVGGDFFEYNDLPSNGTARLNIDGSLDESFVTESGFDGFVFSSILQPDGKILVGGDFKRFNRIPQNYIARLNSDGSLDESFVIDKGFDGSVNTIVLQTDGKILVGGDFFSYNGVRRDNIARLNSDGSLDESFNTGTGFDMDSLGVFSLVIQPDSKIIVGGNFYSFNGSSRNNILRLNSDGSLDESFEIGVGFSETYLWNVVYSIALQPDGKIIVGGQFDSYNGKISNRLIRLNSDGSIDTSFDIGLGFDGNFVRTMLLQPDGKIIAGGDFYNYNGKSSSRLIRLNSDGGLDESFVIGKGFDGNVNSIVLQSDGKILVGGEFNSFNGIANKYIVRLNSNGSLDDSIFNGTGFMGREVTSVLIQSDSKIIIAGGFSSYNSILRSGIVRLFGDSTLSTIQHQAFLNNSLFYPNPTKDVLNINNRNFNEAHVYDMSGRLVKTVSIINQQINLSELSIGNYFIQLQGNNNKETFKIVKQ